MLYYIGIVEEKTKIHLSSALNEINSKMSKQEEKFIHNVNDFNHL